MPKDEGKAIIDRYYERFPGIRAFIHATLAFAREHGFTKTLFGRKTHFEPNIRSPNPSIRGGAERAAINAPIQGTSADLIKRAMARMDGALAEAGLGDVKMLLQVHDELVFEVPDGARRKPRGGDQAGHGERRRAGDEARRAAGRRGRLGRALGRGALTDAERGRARRSARRRHGDAGPRRPAQRLRLRPSVGGHAAVPVHRRPDLWRRPRSGASPMPC